MPTISYATDDGQQVTFEPAINSNIQHYKEGDIVPIIYDPARPYVHAIDTFAEFWGAPIVFWALGTFFAVFGFLMMPHT